MVVGAVRTDPVLRDAVRMILPKCTVVQTDARGPETPYTFEPDRRMALIHFEPREVFVGQYLHFGGQLPVVLPELRRVKMLQSGVQRPAS